MISARSMLTITKNAESAPFPDGWKAKIRSRPVASSPSRTPALMVFTASWAIGLASLLPIPPGTGGLAANTVPLRSMMATRPLGGRRVSAIDADIAARSSTT